MRFKDAKAVTVCVVPKDYPDRGHRLYSPVGIGATFAEAREEVYRKVRAIEGIEKLYCRDDIAAGL